MLKIKIYPTKIQKETLGNWFGTCRYVYNKTLSAIYNTSSNYTDWQYWRNKFVTYKRTINGVEFINTNLYDWELKVPKEVRTHAVRDVTKAFTTCFTLVKKKLIGSFKIRYKNKKKNNDSLGIQKQSIELIKNNNNLSYINIYPNTLGQLKVGKRNSKKHKNLEILHDCRLSYNGIDYFLCIPISTKNKEQKEIKLENKRIVSLDPGCRTFMTSYSHTDGTVKEYGKLTSKIRELRDKVINKINKLKSIRSKKKVKLNKKILKLYKKSSNYIDDLHWKTINNLITNYDTILLPIFESQEMVKKSKYRKLNRMMNELAHYQFRTRLQYKMSSYSNKQLYLVTEEYTSKTCTNCGNLNNKLGSLLEYNCKQCSIKINRDVNGARNIMIKHLKIQ
jgi:putative transposase